MGSIARIVYAGVLIGLPLLLAAGYLKAQDALRGRIASAAQEEVAADAEFLRRYNERYRPQAVVPETGDARRDGSADAGQMRGKRTEDTSLRRARNNLLRNLDEDSSVGVNLAPKALPLAFGAGFGIWASLLVGKLAGRRGRSPTPRGESMARPARSTVRVRRFALPHLIGVTLSTAGMAAAGLVCADLNAYWYRPGLLEAGAALDGSREVPLLRAVVVAAPAALFAMCIGLGAILAVCVSNGGSENRPFLRLSRARALSLLVAACGVAWIAFSIASVVFFETRCTGPQALVRIPDPFDRTFFDRHIGNAALTRIGLPLGVGLVVLGVTASFVAPALLRRREGFLSGATECVDCAQPLLAGQTTCPECGCAHGATRQS